MKKGKITLVSVTEFGDLLIRVDKTVHVGNEEINVGVHRVTIPCGEDISTALGDPMLVEYPISAGDIDLVNSYATAVWTPAMRERAAARVTV